MGPEQEVRLSRIRGMWCLNAQCYIFQCSLSPLLVLPIDCSMMMGFLTPNLKLHTALLIFTSQDLMLNSAQKSSLS